ncbi:MAG: exodeoxyribonuclease III [Nanoarchaeota archaeon]
MKIVSWNVAGIRSCAKKGLVEFMHKQKAEVYCFQEVKCSEEQLPAELGTLVEYSGFHSVGKKKGYSGVSIYSRVKPLSVVKGIGEPLYDDEGRVLALEFEHFFLVNAYFPHAHRELTRLDFKLSFNQCFLEFIKRLEQQKPVIIAADFNVAPTVLDLANPKQNEKNAGFTLQEREWFASFLKEGFVDTFRMFTQGNGHYTWWTYRSDARARNVGWRIDTFVVSSVLQVRVKKSTILKEVMGSDHCPILLEIS